jgi:hypothetical protein
MKRRTFSIFFFIIISFSAFSQSNQFYFKVGTQVPLQHNIGTEFVAWDRLGLQLQYGVLTTPYEGSIRRIITYFEEDPNLTEIINDSFQYGTLLGAGLNYHFGKNYLGAFGQYATLRGASTATAALSAYYGIDFSFLEFLTGPIDLNLQSNLYNLGILYGRRIVLREPDIQIHLELAISKNVSSRNNFNSNRPALDRNSFVSDLYDRVDHELRDTYLAYVIVPTFNVYFVYNLLGR